MAAKEMSIRGLAARVLIKALPLPLQLLSAERRAPILERLIAEMVSTVDIGETEIFMYTPFPYLTWRASSLLTKERDTIAWIDSFDNGSVFWDVGANVGVYSLYAAAKRRAVVLAFEPAAPNFYVLTHNVWLNKLYDLIATYCVALSGGTGLGTLNLSSEKIGAALHQFGEAGERSPYAEEALRPAMHAALGFTVDDFIQLFNPPFPRHLKIDVDGRERAILSGAATTLRDSRLETVLIELSVTNKEDEAAVDILHEAGFRLASQGDIQTGGGHQVVNKLFKRKDLTSHRI
jgi:FkbM family methyltransferase